MTPAQQAPPQPADGVGVIVGLADGSLASAERFHHHPRPLRDPSEERFDSDQVVFTAGGRWRLVSRRGTVDAHPGVVVLGHHGDFYRCEHDRAVSTDRNLVVLLKPGVLRAALEPRPDPLSATLARQPLPDLASLPLTARLRLTARRLAAETQAGLPGHQLQLDCLVVELLVELYRAAGLPGPKPSLVRAHQRATVEAAQRYVHAHLGEDLDLATLAALSHTSPFHFSRLFRTVTGLPPHRYLRRARLERAEQLLTSGDATITTVAHQVGFASVSHFIAAFRRHAGTTPGQYRALLQSTHNDT